MTSLDPRQQVLEKLKNLSADQPTAMVGFDGFIDEICEVVNQRISPTEYTPIQTIEKYAERIHRAAGKSTNFEIILKKRKLGGNCPLMADALGRLGTTLFCVGAFGTPQPDPLFIGLDSYGKTLSLTQPAHTTAYEFDDGKIMNGKLEPLSIITPELLLERFGGREAIIEACKQHQLICMVNWTMIPNLTAIFQQFAELLAEVTEPRFVFVDLCDPVKRTLEELKSALLILSKIQAAGHTMILGLNEQESVEVCRAMNLAADDTTNHGLLRRAHEISTTLGIAEVVIHPIRMALVGGVDIQPATIAGPICKMPLLTTGAGDHFNGGYCFGRLVGLQPADAIITGVATSGFYVRMGRGPSRAELGEFLERWLQDSLDPWE
ncbi:MAG: hypothetical protein ACFCU1_08345 [Sumerlaeia bacterium]